MLSQASSSLFALVPVVLALSGFPQAFGQSITNSSTIFHQWPSTAGGNDHWYAFSSRQLFPSAAAKVAQQWGATLASLTEPGEFDFVRARAVEQSASFLTGLAARPGEVFKWPDQTPVTLEFMQAHGWPSITNLTPQLMGLWIGSQNSFNSIFSNSFAARIAWELTNHPSSLPPAFTFAPVDREHYSHVPAEFQAHALGAEPLHYQWLIDEHPVSGATNTHFTLQISTLSTGLVSVAVSNLNGSIRSAPARLTIIPVEFTGKIGWGQWRIEHGGNDHWYGAWYDYEPTNHLTWHEARTLAQRLGADLVALESEEEWQRLKSFTGVLVPDFPLGLTDASTEGTFLWLNDTPLSFTAWAEGEPSSADPESDYASVTSWLEWRTCTSTQEFGSAWFERTNHPAAIVPLILGEPPSAFRMSLSSTRRVEFDVVAPPGSTYEWRLDGALYHTGSEPFLDFHPATTHRSGLLDLIVRNSTGSATSAPVRVTVFIPEPVTMVHVVDPRANLFELHFDFPPDAEKVILETSFDLVEWLPTAEKTPGMPTRFDSQDIFFSPTAATRFFRLQRWP
jgi:hypothetical protein